MSIKVKPPFFLGQRRSRRKLKGRILFPQITGETQVLVVRSKEPNVDSFEKIIYFSERSFALPDLTFGHLVHAKFPKCQQYWGRVCDKKMTRRRGDC